MAAIRYASDIIEYDRRTSELSYAALHITQDANNIEKIEKKKKGRPLPVWVVLHSQASLPLQLGYFSLE